MKSRKNTINGKTIVTGDPNELAPNEVMINEKLNEDGSINLQVLDLSGQVVSGGSDPNFLIYKTYLDGTYQGIYCRNDGVVVIGRDSGNSYGFNVVVDPKSSTKAYIGKNYNTSKYIASSENNNIHIKEVISGNTKTSDFHIICDSPITLEGEIISENGPYCPEFWSTESKCFKLPEFKPLTIKGICKGKVLFQLTYEC